MEFVDYRDSFEIEGYNIKDYCWSLYNSYGESQKTELIYLADDGTKIVFASINFTIKDETEITGVYLSCYILRK